MEKLVLVSEKNLNNIFRNIVKTIDNMNYDFNWNKDFDIRGYSDEILYQAGLLEDVGSYFDDIMLDIGEIVGTEKEKMIIDLIEDNYLI